MDNPSKPFPSIGFDDDNCIRLIYAAWSGEALELKLEISTFESGPTIWSIRCDKVLAYTLKYAPATSLELVADHPLLWGFKHDSASAFFYGAPANPLAALGALYGAHRRCVGDWFSLDEHLNGSVETAELLAAGHGLLAEGPLPLLAVYKDALSAYGVDVEIRFPYPPGGRLGQLELLEKFRNETKTLLIGESYVTGIGWNTR
jgi:hypothetical protein